MNPTNNCISGNQESHENNNQNNEEEMRYNDMNVSNPFIYSNESFKNQSILKDSPEISYYPQDEEPILFNKKDLAIELLGLREFDNSISIEKVLYYDNTYAKGQKVYLNLAINILLDEKDETKKLVLLEKINKSSIILNEKEYNEEINKLPSEIKEKVKYNNYKIILIDVLELISKGNIEDKIKELINAFHFKIRYEFNQDALLGENNYYFYCLVQQLYSDNLFYINKKINLYKDFIIKAKNFLQKEKDFSNLTQKKKDYFEYLINILLDEAFIEDRWQKKEIENYLDSFGIEEEINEKENMIDDKKITNNKKNDINKNIDYENYIQTVKNAIKNLNNIIQSDEEINYKYDSNEKQIFIEILDNNRVSRKAFSMKKEYSYDIKIFNKGILYILEKEFTYKNYYSFESLLFRNINYGYEEKFIEPFKEKYLEIISKILAAEQFFNSYYGKKYKNLDYHFKRDDVIKEIFKRIKFIPIFNKKEKAFTSPLELKIYISSIPGAFNNYNIRIFERDIMQLARLIVITINVIMGHFLRRYYSFTTNNLIKFNTKEDDDIDMKPESGNFVEKKFLGIIYNHSISFSESIELLKTNLENFPIIRNEIQLKDLEKIIEENKEYFQFISNNNKNVNSTIDLNTFQIYLIKGFTKNTKIISCGFRKENLIFLN